MQGGRSAAQVWITDGRMMWGGMSGIDPSQSPRRHGPHEEVDLGDEETRIVIFAIELFEDRFGVCIIVRRLGGRDLIIIRDVGDEGKAGRGEVEVGLARRVRSIAGAADQEAEREDEGG